jgi:type 1 glutamine amidotransferase
MFAPARAPADDEGFTSIFDGQSLDGWDGDPKLWSVEEGAITGKTSDEDPIQINQFLIWRQGELDDFELKLEYRLVGGNSGIQYRSWEEPDNWGKWVVGGYQADFEAGDKYSGILYGERFRGILALRGQKTVLRPGPDPSKVAVEVVETFGDTEKLQAHVKSEDWNEYRIVAEGFHFTHYINGQKMSECTDEDTANRRRGGILAFQVHRGPAMKVQFRNVRLKRLPLGETKKVVLLAGPKSHGYGAHEHNAGCLLLAKYLNQCVPGVHAVVYRDGWPADPTALDNADAVVVFCDGGGRHPLMGHLEQIDRLSKKGVGVACLHYGVEVPKGEPGNYFLQWIGGYFETDWSVNPHFEAAFTELPQHPITRGVKPFVIEDEWYYHMRFRPQMQGVTPVLTTVPPDSTRERPDGTHSNNPTVRAGRGMPEHVAWASETPGRGRGFGFTGGHWHWNWANDSFRKVVLNGIVWTAGLDVPAEGIVSPTPTMEELEANQDYPPGTDKKNPFDRQKWVDLLQQWKR